MFNAEIVVQRVKLNLQLESSPVDDQWVWKNNSKASINVFKMMCKFLNLLTLQISNYHQKHFWTSLHEKITDKRIEEGLMVSNNKQTEQQSINITSNEIIMQSE